LPSRQASLKHSSLQSKTRANLLSIRPGVRPPLAIEGEVDDAEIDAKHILNTGLLGVGHIADDGEIPFAANEHQVNLARAVAKQSALAFAADKRELDPAGQRPDADLVNTGRRFYI
jgi:hypothetical protein